MVWWPSPPPPPPTPDSGRPGFDSLFSRGPFPGSSQTWIKSDLDQVRPGSSQTRIKSDPDQVRPGSSQTWIKSDLDQIRPGSSQTWIKSDPDQVRPGSSQTRIKSDPDQVRPGSSRTSGFKIGTPLASLTVSLICSLYFSVAARPTVSAYSSLRNTARCWALEQPANSFY